MTAPDPLDEHFYKIKNNYLEEALTHNLLIKELYENFIEFTISHDMIKETSSLFGEF
jgi:hypothetical protein